MSSLLSQQIQPPQQQEQQPPQTKQDTQANNNRTIIQKYFQKIYKEMYKTIVGSDLLHPEESIFIHYNNNTDNFDGYNFGDTNNNNLESIYGNLNPGAFSGLYSFSLPSLYPPSPFSSPSFLLLTLTYLLIICLEEDFLEWNSILSRYYPFLFSLSSSSPILSLVKYTFRISNQNFNVLLAIAIGFISLLVLYPWSIVKLALLVILIYWVLTHWVCITSTLF